ncbi:MAG: BrnT family toxin [Alphaproteobacteria bacterium]|nr:BrnT family toxin [Alphaproteobacteria bacterium]
MAVEFDPAKDKRNREKHGISLERAEDMDIGLALTARDDRIDYGEDRYIAIGPIAGELHVLVYTWRGSSVRAISLRLASAKERKRWSENQP